MSTRRSRRAGSVRHVSRIRASGIGRRCHLQIRPMPRRRSTASGFAPSLPPAIRALLVLDREFETQSVGPDVSRAGMRARLVSTRVAGSWSSCSACSRRTRPQSRSHSFSAKPAARSSRRASTLTSPMSAAGSADATIRPSRSTSHWRRCSFPAARSGSPTIAISSSRRASSGTRSRCTRGSESIALLARSAHSPPTMCWMAAASPIFRRTWPLSAPPRRSASMTFRKSMSPLSRFILVA